MKLSDNTVEILKNLASINMSLLINPGNTLRSCSTNKTILVEATIDESFDKTIGVYDLNKFLALLSMKKGDPDVEIEDKAFAFKGLNNGKIRMRFTEPKILIAPGPNNPNADFNVNFTITQEILNWMGNVASILKCPNISIKSDGGAITLWATDATGAITDDASVTLEGTSEKPFTAVFLVENFMKMIPGTYNIELAGGSLIKATHKDKKISYWIATEEKWSSYDGKSMDRKLARRAKQ